jgi:hypothetical protein
MVGTNKKFHLESCKFVSNIRRIYPTSNSYYKFKIAYTNSKDTLKVKTNRIGILLLDLYGCGIWSFTVRDEYTLGLSENLALRTSGYKREKVTGRGAEKTVRGTSYFILFG